MDINIGDVPVATEGELDCSELITIGGIKEDSEWIISYVDENQKSFPLSVYSIESIENFSQRAK